MSSIAYTQGFYYVPRIDKKVIQQYKEDMCCRKSKWRNSNKVLILVKPSEEALLWWKEEFKEDFYIEVMRHNQEG
jgi:DNA polymerase-3 subunit alpha